MAAVLAAPTASSAQVKVIVSGGFSAVLTVSTASRTSQGNGPRLGIANKITVKVTTRSAESVAMVNGMKPIGGTT